ncbi:hypothetical protein BDA99DRAFT_219093 [Phascolomyces articulosus]|uniref:Rap-GAP domain-containing protein n=1 Tax=Phascolomyces articulosus TaxID=60185 RepID=A0AAD5JQT4_9FUNG|nr:hypothetical protein BDA99DRAFT_219093 [Phascolomyces articulosus]
METSVPDSTWKAVIEMSLDMPFNCMKKIDHETMVSSGLEADILRLDEQAVHDRYKFGVIYVKEGQTKEEEWLSNEHDSEKLDRFLNIIGRRIELQGYTGWAAGLDTRSGDSGEHTFVDEWKEHNIAYHVSSLIPSRQGDKQQVQKKRHIGNDIVCVVFAEGKQPFNPAAIKSQFLHVFIVVHEEEWEGRTGWRVEVAMAEPVPAFSPPLPEKAIFFHESEMRSFILAKLINAEYAAYKSPKFTQPMARAREGILANVTERGFKIAKDPEISFFSKHNKSPSTSSDRSSKSSRSGFGSDHITPTPSRSSMIRELSEGIAGLGRRRSGPENNNQHVDAHPKPTRSNKPARKGKSNNKHAEGKHTINLKSLKVRCIIPTLINNPIIYYLIFNI